MRIKNFFSLKDVFTVQNLTIMALLAAVDVVLARYATIHITPQFTLVSLQYIPSTITAALFGPWAGIVFGIVSDTVGYFSNPVGAYMPVWAISAVVGNLITATFMYKEHFEWWRIILVRLLVILVVTFGLGYLWQSLYFGATASVFFNTTRLISNLVQFPVQVILIRIFGLLSVRAMNRIRGHRQSVV